MRDDDNRQKKSWREIDRQRDGSSRRDDRPGGNRQRGPGREKNYRAALDRLFESGKIADLVEQRDPGSTAAAKDGENRFKLQRMIREAGDRDDVTRAVDEYLEKYGELPGDIEILGRALEHRNPGRQLDAMEMIDTLLDTEKPKRTRAMLGQLKMIRDVGDDPELSELAIKLIDKLE